ncbi:hypothetical protein PL263_10520 [Methylomonas sp. EFPC3]|uniref:DUF7673 family protein n=1 Tax=Methylomonas sp. EFPC3 TaxID=3021710 RepID=UPI002417A06A|nr:hypothetical protein [Methylomonas sp. EFPC3]WFP48547.1 hypothetical protein PL263_10520 [Methylomonas sp. EFPC3]
MQTQDKEHNAATAKFIQQIAEYELERTLRIDAGVPALHRLVKVAKGDTGQAETVRAFLLGLYNGYNFPFNLVSLRSIDKELFDDCIDVLALDARATQKEIHLYIDHPHPDTGSKLFKQWARQAIDQINNSH